MEESWILFMNPFPLPQYFDIDWSSTKSFMEINIFLKFGWMRLLLKIFMYINYNCKWKWKILITAVLGRCRCYLGSLLDAWTWPWSNSTGFVCSKGQYYLVDSLRIVWWLYSSVLCMWCTSLSSEKLPKSAKRFNSTFRFCKISS